MADEEEVSCHFNSSQLNQIIYSFLVQSKDFQRGFDEEKEEDEEDTV